MTFQFFDIYQSVADLENSSDDYPCFAVRPISSYPNYFVGKDENSSPCMLIRSAGDAKRTFAPILLEDIQVNFSLHCRVESSSYSNYDYFTVIYCRQNDSLTIRYFFSICESILRILGGTPSTTDIDYSLRRIVALFQFLKRPATKSLVGLFGELFTLSHSQNPIFSMKCWRAEPKSRFDFSFEGGFLEVKATTTRRRIHSFSFDQCNAPGDVVSLVVSLFVEQVSKGVSLQSMISQIESQIASEPDLVFKLHENVASALGSTIHSCLPLHFDLGLSESSFMIFDLSTLPAVRGPLPEGVTGVRFESDLSFEPPALVREMTLDRPLLLNLLPTFVTNAL